MLVYGTYKSSILWIFCSSLEDTAGVRCRGDAEQWFFFVPRQEREARGGRPSRITGSGYWKATGSPGPVFSKDNRMIGVKKTMVFYTGKAPTGRKTKWKMNEYKAVDETVNVSTIPKVVYVYIYCVLDHITKKICLNLIKILFLLKM